MNQSVDLSQVAGKNIEDLTRDELCAIGRSYQKPFFSR